MERTSEIASRDAYLDVAFQIARARSSFPCKYGSRAGDARGPSGAILGEIAWRRV